MLPAVAYTLADFLDSGIPSISTESIRFEHPSFASAAYPSLNLYLCNIHRNTRIESAISAPTGNAQLGSRLWFDTSFLLTVQEHTQLGKQRLIEAAMTHCLQHPYLSDHQLAPTLKGYGRIPLRVNPVKPTLWNGLDIPQQPAIHLTLTVPFAAIRPALPMTA